MEEQIRKNSSSVEVNLLDSSISRSDESQQAQRNSMLQDRAINVKRDEGAFVIIMSKEELMIRDELEIEIERNLEEEIKDEIYNLGLRLHRLYCHRRERIAGSNNRYCRSSSSGSRSRISKSKNNATYSTISEMNITIKIGGGGGGGGGGSKIEIKEIEKRNGGHDQKVTRPKTSDNYKQAKMYRCCIKEFDWVRTLRSSSSSSSSGATNGFVISSPKKL